MKYYNQTADGRVSIEWELCAMDGVPVTCVTNLSETLGKMSDADIASISDGLEFRNPTFVDDVRISSSGQRLIVSRKCRMESHPTVMERLKSMRFTALISAH